MKKALLPLAVFLTALLAPLAASAQSYPYYPFEATSFETGTPYSYSQSSCVAAYSQQLGHRCWTGSRSSNRLAVLGPQCGDASACPTWIVSQCQYLDDGQIGPVAESCSSGGFCPYGGTQSGTTCIAAACPNGGVRDPATGKCAPIKLNKALGPACERQLSIGNPCNAGTGTKHQIW